jgi:hypothetical protein
MFTRNDLIALLTATPFAPFRLHLSSGGHVDVRHKEFSTMVGKGFAVIGVGDPQNPDAPFDRYVTVYYMHVTDHEMLWPGPAPGGEAGPQPETPAGTPS